ncbi:MAG TPA: HAMP domain-containing sensor histidine kinase [Blastocatellia bacterium]|nr:HAMP domain-containing sensor histidine kinase [Blastocatellia bacterium]
MKDTIYPGLVAVLDMVVLERREPGVFERLGPATDWFAQLVPDGAGEAPVEPGQHLPFLDAFLYDAEEFWAANESGSMKSGPWIEIDSEGRQHNLEATAASLGEHKLLIVEHPRISYEEHLAAIQTGRETTLDRDRMLRETQKKEILLHCIVHDLKGPLNGIVGSVSLLAGQDVDPSQKEMYDIALRQASKLDMLIQGILSAFSAEIASLESFEFDKSQAPDALEIASDSAMAMAPAFKLQRVTVELDPDIDPFADWHVVGEKVRLERVLSNLLGNALRYSPKGSTVRIGLAREDGWIRMSVDDEGPGVPEDVQGRLFQKFSQGKTKSGSVGLGLYFCRMTVERWGGEIGYSTRPEGGSSFWFRLKPVLETG